MKFVFLFLTFFYSLNLQANSLCFEIYDKTNLDSNVQAISSREGIAFVTLNQDPIPFYTIPSSKVYGTRKGSTKIIASRSRGCASLHSLVVGTNQIFMGYIFNNLSYLNGWFESTLYMINSQQGLEVICSSLISDGSTHGNCSSSFHKELREINPELAREIELLAEEFKKIKRFEKVDEFAEMFRKASELLNLLQNIDFEFLSERAFELFQLAHLMISSLKNDIDTLKREIKITHEEIKRSLENTKQLVQDELGRVGITISELPNVDVSFSMGAIPLPSLETCDTFNSDDNIYKTFADKTISALQSDLKNNDRIAFLKEVLIWKQTAETYEQIATNRETFSKKEWQASRQQYERVHTFIYSHVDKDLWFKDSPVPSDVRTALRSEMKTVAPEESSKLETVLKKLSTQNLTNQEKRGIEMVQALDVVAKGILRTAKDSIETVQEFRGYVKQTAEAISTGAKCLTQAQVSGRLGSLYELFSGKDQCSGDELSEGGRLFAGIELALGTPKIFKAIGAVIGVGGLFGKNAAKIHKASENILEAATKHKIDFKKLDATRLKSNPIKETRYTDKVKAQMSKANDKFHGFPKEVDNFAGLGTSTQITGGDGVKRTKISLEGEYAGRKGNFEWIVEPDGSINHRKFEPL